MADRMTDERLAAAEALVNAPHGGVPFLQSAPGYSEVVRELVRLRGVEAERDAALQEVDQLRRALNEMTETKPDIAIAYVVSRSMDEAEVPTTLDGKALSLARRFDLLMRNLDVGFRFTKPFLDMMEMAERENTPNFVTGDLRYRDVTWEVTVRRPDGKTPTTVIGELRAERDALKVEIQKLEEHQRKQRREITAQQNALRERNIQLDALHHVWCGGACETGTHRYDHGEVTGEVVTAAIRNTARLVDRWIRVKGTLHIPHMGTQAAFERARTELMQADALRAALRTLIEHTKRCSRFLADAVGLIDGEGICDDEDGENDEAILVAANASKAADDAEALLAEARREAAKT